MKLKEFLELIRTNEEFNLYDPVENEYLQLEIFKENVREEYFGCKVTGVNANFSYGNDAILEIDIVR